MKVSFQSKKPLDTKQLLRMTGVLQGRMFLGLTQSSGKGRLKAFKLEYEELTVNYPAKDGELIVEL